MKLRDLSIKQKFKFVNDNGKTLSDRILAKKEVCLHEWNIQCGESGLFYKCDRCSEICNKIEYFK
jgi:DNA polymerase III gamma/tau subunit